MSKHKKSRGHLQTTFKADLIEGLNGRIGTIIAIGIAIIITIITVYLRLIPGILYGTNMVNGNDPWILYWLSNYFYHHGVFNLAPLKDVKMFWYPWGRNFLKSEYVGGAMLIALVTKYITGRFGLSVIQTLALQPVFLAGLDTIVMFFMVWKLTNSRLAGIASSIAFAFYPGAFLFKAFADYPGKTNAGLAFFTLGFLFMVLGFKSLKKVRSLIYMYVGGLFAGFVSWMWGGYSFITLIISFLLLIDPLMAKPTRDRFLKLLLLSLGFATSVISSPDVGIHYFTRDIGLAIPILLAVYAIEVYMDKIPLDKIGLTRKYDNKVQAWVIIAGVALVGIAIYSNIITFPSRVLLALGVLPSGTSVVSLTVAEYAKSSLSTIFQSFGPAIIVTIIGLIILSYHLIRNKERSLGETLIVVFFIAAFIFLYGTTNESYFIATSNYFFDIAAGITIGLLFGIKKEQKVKEIRTRKKEEVEPAALVLGLLLFGIVAGFGVYYAFQDYTSMHYMPPAIKTGWMQPLSFQTPSGPKALVPLNNAWLLALNYLKHNTSNNALVVSWWDYGYWIGVISNRTTVADGATLNGTQIQILARILTGNPNASSALLKYFHAKPNNTYLLTYEVFVGEYNNSTRSVIMFPYPNIVPISQSQGLYAITYGMGDMAKSFQMLRIAYRINPYTPTPLFTNYSSETTYQGDTFIQFPGLIGSPRKNVTVVLNTLLYSMMLNGIKDLKQYGVFGKNALFLKNATSFEPAGIAYASNTGLTPEIINPFPLKHFVPVAIFISNPANINLGKSVDFYSVVVFIYKWTG
ncbi:MAG: hypothetical protein G5Z42_05700 [Caldisphaeraceae archaeon]|nr:hypothetical protein [Caldisphaeraceae archaeon]MEB3692285.1 hypothetical protein [Caldisphaeraceae archaeon]MEB3798292.1 hypothetical protein [Caldisphaeraceae archaeon]